MNKKELFLKEINEYKKELLSKEKEEIIEKEWYKLYFMKTIENYLENKDDEELEEVFKNYDSIYCVYKKFMSCTENNINTYGDLVEMLDY